MVRKNLFITDDQEKFLRSLGPSDVRRTLGSNDSAHIRRALDNYIVLYRNQNASTSVSKITKGGKNG